MYSIYPPESNHNHDFNSYVVTIPNFLPEDVQVLGFSSENKMKALKTYTPDEFIFTEYFVHSPVSTKPR